MVGGAGEVVVGGGVLIVALGSSVPSLLGLVQVEGVSWVGFGEVGGEAVGVAIGWSCVDFCRCWEARWWWLYDFMGKTG